MRFMTRLYRMIGPGVITGAADDDPSGIATYSQTGAQLLPLQVSIQEASARIGAVTGKGIAAIVKKNYSKKVLYIIVVLEKIMGSYKSGLLSKLFVWATFLSMTVVGIAMFCSFLFF